MVRSNIISAAKANSLYWLGRYENRVYMTIHLMNKCYDKMIDGEPADYEHLRKQLDVSGAYMTPEDFTAGMLFDDYNFSSVISTQQRAMDNAILLREDITSETLSYLEMSMALLREHKGDKISGLTMFQPIIDWSFAFWGSAEQRLENQKALLIMLVGRDVEYLDMLLRFNYPYRKVLRAYNILKNRLETLKSNIDEDAAEGIDNLLNEHEYMIYDENYKNALIKLVNQLVQI